MRTDGGGHPMTDNKRKACFINKQFQMQFVARFCSLVVLGASLTVILVFLYLFYEGSVTVTFVNSTFDFELTADYLLPIMLAVSGISILVIGIAAAITAVYFSHRIAGPMYRIERVTGAIASGDLTQCIKLRTNDEMQKTAEDINGMVEAIRVRVARARVYTVEVGARIQALKGVIQDNAAARHVLEQLAQEHRKLDDEVSVFKTE
jgi:methyl-accepting chemotaxis protein